jgi:poly(A) polymerase
MWGTAVTDAVARALAALQTLAPDGFLVGGCVRDWLLGRPLKDLDVAVPAAWTPRAETGARAPHATGEAMDAAAPPTERVREVGKAVAAELGGTFFWLREGMGVARIVVPDAEPLQVDVVPLAESLEADLRRRDFTINAMAVRARDGFDPQSPILDPTQGRRDLKQRRLRLAAPDALRDDPLRCLRAYRFRASLDLTFDQDLPALIRSAAPGLSRVSGERIRDELFVLLEGAQTADVMADLLEVELVSPWSAALAESAAGRPPAAEPDAGIDATGLQVVRALDALLEDGAFRPAVRDDLAAALASRVTPPRSRAALTRLAALAVRAGPAVAEIVRALALSGEEARVVRRSVGGASALHQARPISGSERLRFWQQWEPGAVEAVLLAIAALMTDARCRSRGGEPVDESTTTTGQEQPTTSLGNLLSDALERRLRPQPSLLTGDEVMSLLELEPGPEVGRTLQEIEERRADGLLQTADEAREWLRRRSLSAEVTAP